MIEKSSGARGAAQFSNEVIPQNGLEQWETGDLKSVSTKSQSLLPVLFAATPKSSARKAMPVTSIGSFAFDAARSSASSWERPMIALAS
jgi:hypothetical protein